jgi:hypothetical protein
MIGNLKSNTDKNEDNTICLKLSGFTVASLTVCAFRLAAGPAVYRNRGAGVAAEAAMMARACPRKAGMSADKSNDAIKGK